MKTTDFEDTSDIDYGMIERELLRFPAMSKLNSNERNDLRIIMSHIAFIMWIKKKSHPCWIHKMKQYLFPIKSNKLNQ